MSFLADSSKERLSACDAISKALMSFGLCVNTSEGSRIQTHCLYPSFEPVYVFVAKVGDEYKIHDGGGAYRESWLHGRDEALISRYLKSESKKYHLELVGNSLVCSASSVDWLGAAIVSVANASSIVAGRAVEHAIAVAEEALIDRIEHNLKNFFRPEQIGRDVEVRGLSGGKRYFDFVLKNDVHQLLINGVAPHHGSVASRYVSFADTDGDVAHKLAVYDKPLNADDAALLGQVASVLPLASLAQGAGRLIH